MHLEPQRARCRVRFNQLHVHGVAQSKPFAAPFRDECARGLNVLIIVTPKRCHRHEPVRAGACELHEQTEPRDARDARLELVTDTLGQMTSR